MNKSDCLTLYRFIVQFAFQFFVVGNFAHSLHEIFLNDILAFGSKIEY